LIYSPIIFQISSSCISQKWKSGRSSW